MICRWLIAIVDVGDPVNGLDIGKVDFPYLKTYGTPDSI